ncbi:hypothetical protein WN51_12654 [Melipona quadrifasciata]|uniref:Uncharacterized protein n=1 Tax=Melipona quadrifasciata TaxID=166423 RepID=A0A0M9A0Q3_9HYME|nr:hypothetical protein WN51_12654 [Melipona quadrifasciata]
MTQMTNKYLLKISLREILSFVHTQSSLIELSNTKRFVNFGKGRKIIERAKRDTDSPCRVKNEDDEEDEGEPESNGNPTHTGYGYLSVPPPPIATDESDAYLPVRSITQHTMTKNCRYFVNFVKENTNFVTLQESSHFKAWIFSKIQAINLNLFPIFIQALPFYSGNVEYLLGWRQFATASRCEETKEGGKEMLTERETKRSEETRKERKKERKKGRKKGRKKVAGKGHFCESQLPSDLAIFGPPCITRLSTLPKR